MLSFQRFVWPPSGVVLTAPRSLGALPVACPDERDACVPVADGDALWIGLRIAESSRPVVLAIAAERSDGSTIDVLSGAMVGSAELSSDTVPPRQRIDGIARSDGGFDVIGRASAQSGVTCTRLTIRTRSQRAQAFGPVTRVDLVDYATFERISGRKPPPPIDPNAGYKGYRLP